MNGDSLAIRCQNLVHPQALVDEKMPENALAMGELLRSELSKISSPRLASVRGRGLMNAIVIKEHDGVAAWDVCLRLRDNGLLVRACRCCMVLLHGVVIEVETWSVAVAERHPTSRTHRPSQPTVIPFG